MLYTYIGNNTTAGSEEKGPYILYYLCHPLLRQAYLLQSIL